ncbi:GNAT family N-acetyltransferase [Actinospica robiniae]|uniref:GNAT family N-acetyltransferase n=1 Tax=Actinospica robiniae TaxID=304901 RepID=UPI000415E471|nr:GNAT family N-acetyltransferase [Actinospica robiniae]
MTTDPLVARARALWQELAGEPVSFDPAGGVRVVVAPESRLCPRGWVGAVAIGGSVLVTAPDESVADAVGTAFCGLSVEAMVNPDTVAAMLPVAERLGPATLAYLSPAEFRPAVASGLVVEQLPAEHSDLRELERSATAEEAGEAGLDGVTSPAFVVRIDGTVVAAAGYRGWPGRTAHVSILTAPAWRGRGLGRAAASSAVAHALAEELLPQWRARPPASRRVASALGFRELGAQLSWRPTGTVKLDEPEP